MGLFVPKPHLEDGETIVLKRAANRAEGGKARGGHLFATNRRLIFAPNVIDRVTGAKVWACKYSEIELVGTAERTFNEPFSGGARRRLELRFTDGHYERFVVNHLNTVQDALLEVIARY